ncbi:hypothetical protein FNU79_12800 [Deinococcus detaillensis]|uniref:DUF5723 domain-containing protein n=1 Tax=Deinococcus detaillensis TaxID=2592048 RepID=A0A553US07_9DEIO|nr:hypothetical protein [Deinococcus detaillensis]TSA82994.1 hypothetical protein FNU79_12800 [Deinococcus detaillensis]
MTPRLFFRSLLKLTLLGSTLLASALLGSAQAVTYDFGASLASSDLAVSGVRAFSVRAGVSDVLLGQNRFSLALSNRAAEVGVQRNQALFTIGTVRLAASGALVYAGPIGTRLRAEASGSLGPVALSASGQLWNSPAAALDPLLVWSQMPVNLNASGLQANLEAKYRPSRDLILTFAGELGSQSLASLTGEWRADALSYRLGASAGKGVVAALAGVTYRAENFTVAADALVGRAAAGQATLGGALSLDAPAALPLNDAQAIGLSAYLKYEPWRTAALPLRYGVDVDVPLGAAVDGQLNLGLRGGSGGFGVRAGYTFTPGAGTSGP